MSLETLAFWGLAIVAVVGALAVVFSRDMIRMVIGLGAFLLAVAGYFLYYRMTLLGTVQVFVYVGGVLVMMLLAIMAVRRDSEGRPRLDSRFDLSAFVVSIGFFALLQWTLAGSMPDRVTSDGVHSVDEVGAELLGPMLPHFQVAAVLLLVALVAVVAIVGGRRER